MIQLNMEDNIAQISSEVKNIGAQLPDATSQAINKTLPRVNDAGKTEIVKKVDRPTPNSVDAFFNKWSSKTTLEGAVVLKNNASYLAGLIEGGAETKKKAVPGIKEKLNEYGNLPRTRTRNKNVFWGSSIQTKIEGWWTDVQGPEGRELQLVAFIPDKREYNALIDFYGEGAKAVDQYFNTYFSESLDSAIATAK